MKNDNDVYLSTENVVLSNIGYCFIMSLYELSLYSDISFSYIGLYDLTPAGFLPLPPEC